MNSTIPKFFVTCLFLLFSLCVSAQSEPLEINTSISLMARDLGSVLEHWTPGLRAVQAKDWLAIPTQKVTLTQISETEIEVKLNKPFKFFLHLDGEVVEKSLERFVITDTTHRISKLMSYEVGMYVTNKESRHRNIRKLIKTMLGEGMTQRMANFFSNGAPLPIYKLTQLDIDIRVTDVLSGGKGHPISLGYHADILFPHKFYELTHKTTPLGINRVGRLIDINSGLVRAYLSAYRDLKNRVATLKGRGWWDGMDLKPQTTEGMSFSNMENVEELLVRCNRVFQ